jgi:murein DD-endopeptidase MepM/ murein hydrolase activator NlpD
VRYLIVLLGLLAAQPAEAGRLELDGRFTQGGLVFGTTEADAEVFLGERKLRVSPEGRFLFGFGREAPAEAILYVRFADGSEERRALRIEKRTYKIQRIDGLPRKMVSPPESALARIRAENARIAALREADRPEALFESGFEWPARGRISGVYGSQRILNGEPRRPHYGVDVAAPVGTPVTAPADGIVVLAETGMYYTGGTVILDHGHGLTSAFLHMQDVRVTPGIRVRQGDVIGTLGATGRATGPHLDWRMNWFDQRVDPQLLVGPMPEAGG